MTFRIVSLTLVAPDRLKMTVHKGNDLIPYEFTQRQTRLFPVTEFDDRFHQDFRHDYDARMLVLKVAGRAFSGEKLHLPIELPEAPAGSTR